MPQSSPRDRPSKFAVAVAVGCGSLGAGVAWLAFVWSRDGGDATIADRQASVLAAIVALLVAGSSLYTWAAQRRHTSSQPATADQITLALATLAGAVGEQWAAEAAVRSLGDPQPIPVKWHISRPSVMDHPDQVGRDGPVTFDYESNDIGSLTQAFLNLRRKRLVITGDAGTGKTTLAVQLLLELLNVRQENEPVPVLLSAASWLPESQRNVNDWIASQLDQAYPVLRSISPDAPAALAAQQKILPVIDGLDEVPLDRRSQMVKALNKTLPIAGGLILTSRFVEYVDTMQHANDAITGAAVIEPLRLSRENVASYLRSALPVNPDPALLDMIESIEQGTRQSLVAVTSTALGLWLVRSIYIDGERPATELSDSRFDSTAVVTEHLFSQLIPVAAMTRLPQRRRRAASAEAPLRPDHYRSPEELRRWLSKLAVSMSQFEISRDWRWWELSANTFSSWWSRICVGAATWAAASAVMYLVFKLASFLSFEIDFLFGDPAEYFEEAWWILRQDLMLVMQESVSSNNLGLLLTGGAAVGIVAAWSVGKSDEPHIIQPGRIVRPTIRVLTISLAWGSFLGATSWISANFLVGYQPYHSSIYVGFGIVVTVVIISNMSLERQESQRGSSSPPLNFMSDRAGQLRYAISHSVFFFVATFATYGLAGTASSFDNIISAGSSNITIPIVLAPALVAVLLCNIVSTRWFRFTLATAFLALMGALPSPWSIMRILDDAHRIGLLRVVGPVYQFRHAELQDFLVAAPSS